MQLASQLRLPGPGSKVLDAPMQPGPAQLAQGGRGGWGHPSYGVRDPVSSLLGTLASFLVPTHGDQAMVSFPTIPSGCYFKAVVRDPSLL